MDKDFSTKNTKKHEGKREDTKKTLFLSLFLSATAIIFLASCQVASPIPASITPSASPTATLTATPTPGPTSTITPLPSLTPEPEWYTRIDPSLGALEYQYAEVTNPKARIYASFDDAVA